MAPQTAPDQTELLRAQLAAAQHQLEHLQAALETSRSIGTAIGIIMALQKVTADCAFEVLVRASQRGPRKVRDIAEDVVRYGTVIEQPTTTPRTGPTATTGTTTAAGRGPASPRRADQRHRRPPATRTAP